MQPAFRRSFIGYSRKAADALLVELESEIQQTEAAYQQNLAQLTGTVEALKERVQRVEAAIAAEREEQRALQSVIETLENRGQEIVAQAHAAFEAEETALGAELTHREAWLGQRRAWFAEAHTDLTRRVRYFASPPAADTASVAGLTEQNLVTDAPPRATPTETAPAALTAHTRLAAEAAGRAPAAAPALAEAIVGEGAAKTRTAP